MDARLKLKLTHALDRYLPEQRLFLRSDTETRFIRLRSSTQAFILTSGALLVGWSILATAMLLMITISAGSVREQAAREQQLYEDRLNELSTERDLRAAEAQAALDRFSYAMKEISDMQSRLLASEERRRELETGIEVIQTTLRTTMQDRDQARDDADQALARLNEVTGTAQSEGGHQRALETSVDVLAAALAETSEERDAQIEQVELAEAEIHALKHEARLTKEKTDRIFAQLEDAVNISLTPLNKMFTAAGLPADRIIETVRAGYSGQGGPLEPIAVSTKGEASTDVNALRANALLGRLDEVNLYRLAADKIPFAMPVHGGYRFTSGFGYRSDPKGGGRRMHSGADFAGRSGTPIHATADGVVIHAGWQSGYGRLIKIQHEFGIETRYAHLSKIRVSKGQRVSRGDRIGDMGSSGRSTGTHLHYEVRVGGNAKNPMSYIKAARDVF